MPCKIKVKVLAGRNLPVMDRAGDTTDAFVEIKFAGITHKTDVCRKSLNPHWNSTEWYRFEVDESELQDEPLQLRLMDHDTYSANDAIGKVVISLAPLLAKEANSTKGNTAPQGGAVMSGWIPVFDTMHGIRGELNIIVKVDLFSDFNKYKTSSCGVQFFHCPTIPPGYKITGVHGFVEELVVNDDPEYQWIDKIRTPRASNEARQVAFIKLSNQVQRLVGLKAAELGANAVMGYQQDFDLEGEAGVVARAIGTAVSITPLPTPSQPLNIPPCTQQQLRKYLDILAIDGEDITDLNAYFQSHQDELSKLLNVLHPRTTSLFDEPDNDDDDDKGGDFTRQSSIKTYNDNTSLYQDEYASHKSLRHLTEDQTDLNKLLNRKNDDEDSDSSGPISTIKKIKSSFLTRKFPSIRSRKSEKSDDQISLKSNSSDVSRISLGDIRNEFKKLKRLKKPKSRKAFVNNEEEGIGMASILARSVIHARTSLACIAETQDSEASPASTMRRPSESEPTLNISDDEKKTKDIEILTDKEIIQIEAKAKLPEIRCTSLHNLNTDEILPTVHRKLSESCPTSPIAMKCDLLKPGEVGYFGSVSSALSGESSEIYSTSEGDDEESNSENQFETTSSVVQTVLNKDVDPKIVAQMERKLSVFDEPPVITRKERSEPHVAEFMEESTEPETDSQEHPDNIKQVVAGTKTSQDKDEKKHVKGIPSLHFNFHNPFTHKKISKSVSAPSSPVEKTNFVYRSSRRIKRQLSKISKSSMMKSLSHYSLLPKKRAAAKSEMTQSNSGSDVTSKAPSDTVLGSPFLSYTDLLSLDKEYDTNEIIKRPDYLDDPSHVKMYIGSEPVSRTSFSGPSSLYEESHGMDRKVHRRDKIALKPTGLVHTAMETILMDKVQSLMVPASPDVAQHSDKKFFDDVSQKLEKIEDANAKHHEVIRSKNLRKQSYDETPKQSESSGLIQTAMRTMLIDKVQSLLPPVPLVTVEPKSEIEKIEDAKHRQAMRKEHLRQQSYDGTPKVKESTSLLQTAMQTMLIDKVHSLLPPVSTDPVLVEHEDEPSHKIEMTADDKDHEFITHEDVAKKTHKKTEPPSLMQTAIQTMLIDKVQTLLPTASEPDDSNQNFVKPIDTKHEQQKPSSDEESIQLKSTGLVKTAMQTMLIEKVQSLLPPESTDNILEEQKFVDNVSEKLRIIETLPSSDEEVEKLDKRKLIRQDSIHDDSADQSRKMSKEIDANIIPCKVARSFPVLQHFHPILSGPNLETIPSLPESQTESLDTDGVESNQPSVCDNSHAACVDRSQGDRNEREKEKDKDKGSPRHARHESYGGKDPGAQAQQNSSVNAASTPVGIHRRSSDSDLSVTPKGGSLNTSVGNTGNGGGAILRPSMNSNNLDLLEYPFLTMTEYPPGFIVHIGGTVCARSVKLVHSVEEATCRASWWAELRTELRAHARALRCNAVLKYSDTAVMCEDVCILSASGTAAVINLDCDFNGDVDPTTVSTATKEKAPIEEEKIEPEPCSIAHVPYSPGSGPYRAELSLCGVCRRARVPAVLLSTCAKPKQLASHGKAIHITAVASRIRRAPPTSEPGARDISDQLPFLEYELHKLLLAKLRMQGANALFNLETRICCGPRCVCAVASGTAVRLIALPPPSPPNVKSSENDKGALELQKKLWETFQANKVANGYDVHVEQVSNGGVEVTDEAPALDLCADKDACLLELDDADDVETAKSLAVRRPHLQIYESSLKTTKAPPYAFAQVCRGRVVTNSSVSTLCSRAFEIVTYKLRRLAPYVVAAPVMRLDLPDDEIQLMLSGTAIPLDTSKPELPVETTSHEEDDIFTLDEDQLVNTELDSKQVSTQPCSVRVSSSATLANGSPRGVCALRLLFVRETTCVRELGGLSGFLHTFTCEVLAIVRAYTAALGGNTLSSFYITQLMLQDNAHKNQGQCLLAVGGDVVYVNY